MLTSKKILPLNIIIEATIISPEIIKSIKEGDDLSSYKSNSCLLFSLKDPKKIMTSTLHNLSMNYYLWAKELVSKGFVKSKLAIFNEIHNTPELLTLTTNSDKTSEIFEYSNVCEKITKIMNYTMADNNKKIIISISDDRKSINVYSCQINNGKVFEIEQINGKKSIDIDINNNLRSDSAEVSPADKTNNKTVLPASKFEDHSVDVEITPKEITDDSEIIPISHIIEWSANPDKWNKPRRYQEIQNIIYKCSLIQNFKEIHQDSYNIRLECNQNYIISYIKGFNYEELEDLTSLRNSPSKESNKDAGEYPYQDFVNQEYVLLNTLQIINPNTQEIYTLCNSSLSQDFQQVSSIITSLRTCFGYKINKANEQDPKYYSRPNRSVPKADIVMTKPTGDHVDISIMFYDVNANNEIVKIHTLNSPFLKYSIKKYERPVLITSSKKYMPKDDYTPHFYTTDNIPDYVIEEPLTKAIEANDQQKVNTYSIRTADDARLESLRKSVDSDLAKKAAKEKAESKNDDQENSSSYSLQNSPTAHATVHNEPYYEINHQVS